MGAISGGRRFLGSGESDRSDGRPALGCGL